MFVSRNEMLPLSKRTNWKIATDYLADYYHRIINTRFIIPKNVEYGGNSACASRRASKGKWKEKEEERNLLPLARMWSCLFVGFVEKDDISPYDGYESVKGVEERIPRESILLASSSRLSILEYHGERGWNNTTSRSFSGWKGSRDPPEFPLLFLRSVFKVTLSLRSRKGASWPRNTPPIEVEESGKKRRKDWSSRSFESRLRIPKRVERKLYVQGQWREDPEVG